MINSIKTGVKRQKVILSLCGTSDQGSQPEEQTPAKNHWGPSGAEFFLRRGILPASGCDRPPKINTLINAHNFVVVFQGQNRPFFQDA